jgi:hypothetical protein
LVAGGGSHDAELAPVDVATARRLVAGAVRFSREHDFRLPRKYERWVSILGVDPQAADADISEFGVDGKLRYVGRKEDLAKRLIHESVDQFLRREDVTFVLPEEYDEDDEYYDDDDDYGADDEYDDQFDDDDEQYADDEEDDQLTEEALDRNVAAHELMLDALDMTREKLADAVRKWCFANAQAPSPAIGEAAEMLLLPMLERREQMPEDPDEQPSAAAIAEEDRLVQQALELHTGDKLELAHALDQVGQFLHSLKSPEELISVLGMQEDADQD